jgi:hypothetical protein
VNARRQLVALAGALLGACSPHVSGNGVFREENRNVAPFEAIAVADGIDATVVVSPGADPTVRVSGDDNVLRYVETEVDGQGVLSARCTLGSGELDETIPLRLWIEVPALLAIAVSGESHAEVSGAAAPSFAARAEDLSELHLGGAGGASLSAVAAGRSRVDATGYPVQGAAVDLSGGSVAQLLVDEAGTVTGDAREGSSVEVSGGGACAVTCVEGSTCSR